ncbi:hypothetical protein Tco_1552744 [Tanacetum coccineum]
MTWNNHLLAGLVVLEIGIVSFNSSLLQLVKALLFIKEIESINTVLKVTVNGQVYPIRVFEDHKHPYHLLKYSNIYHCNHDNVKWDISSHLSMGFEEEPGVEDTLFEEDVDDRVHQMFSVSQRSGDPCTKCKEGEGYVLIPRNDVGILNFSGNEVESRRAQNDNIDVGNMGDNLLHFFEPGQENNVAFKAQAGPMDYHINTNHVGQNNDTLVNLTLKENRINSMVPNLNIQVDKASIRDEDKELDDLLSSFLKLSESSIQPHENGASKRRYKPKKKKLVCGSNSNSSSFVSCGHSNDGLDTMRKIGEQLGFEFINHVNGDGKSPRSS